MDTTPDDVRNAMLTSSLISLSSVEPLNPVELISTSNSSASRLGKRPKYLGIFLAVISSFFFSVASATVKTLKMVTPYQLAVFRFIGVLMPTIPILTLQIFSMAELWPKGKRLMLLIRSILGCTSLMMQFYAIQLMPLGDASAIIFSAPVFVAILARIVLKERFGRATFVSIVLMSTGVLLIARPPFLFGSSNGKADAHDGTWKVSLIALLGTILSAGVYVMLRILKGVPAPVILLNFSSVAIIVTSLAAQFIPEEGMCMPSCVENWYQRLAIIVLAVASFMGQILLTHAFKWEQAGPLSIARTTDIVFAFIWQYLIFHETPHILSTVGAVLITLAIILIGLKKWVAALPPNAPARHRLGWLDK